LQPPLKGTRGQANQANPRFTFQSFVPGGHNRIALSAAQDVAENPDSPYSPLFLTGAEGCGKTHLLHAIAQACDVETPYCLATADQFVSDFTTAIRNRSGPAFRSQYRDVDVFLLDDVHVLAGKKASLTEFFNTVANLRDHGRRVVIAGDLATPLADGV